MNRLQLAVAAATTAAVFFATVNATVHAALPATAPGMPDPTFGVNGNTLSSYAAKYDYAKHLVIQQDGKYVIGGWGDTGTNGIGFVGRYLPDGKPDVAFYGTGKRVLGDATLSLRVGGVALTADGKFIVVGTMSGAAAGGGTPGYVMRLNADGSTDTSFGTGGETRFVSPALPLISLRAVTVLPDGRILVAGQENDEGDTDDRPFVLRLTPGGQPDATFAPGGKQSLNAIAPRFIPERIGVAANGKIVISGYAWTLSNPWPDEATVLQLNPDGSPDAGFAQNGRYTHDTAGKTAVFEGMWVDPAGTIVVTGAVGSGSSKNAIVLRLTPSGAPDNGFGFLGVVTLPEQTVVARGIARQSDAKLVIGASAYVDSQYKARVLRLLPNGALDPGFGTGGISGNLGYHRGFADALAIDADGKIVVAGTAAAVSEFDHSLIARVIGTEITTPVVEFYNGPLDHYFITADPAEASAIDNGAAGPGWNRTGQTFKSGGPNRVCRFYGSPEVNPATGARRGPNSHFYTIEAGECSAVKTDAGWKFESYDFNGWPIPQGGCPQGTQPIKRVYNKRFAQNDSNHRYITTDALYQQMTAQGWAGEGTVFCAAL